MLTKAILTGGVLSVLAGSIVYFGTEGADATEVDTSDSFRVEETELAGAADVTLGDTDLDVEEDLNVAVEAADPPKDTPKSKTKWLDQYLKKTKPEPKEETPEMKEEVLEIEIEPESIDAQYERAAARVEKRIKRLKRNSGGDEAVGTYIISKDTRVETREIDEDVDIDIEALMDDLGLEDRKDVQVRVIKKRGNGELRVDRRSKRKDVIDYEPILAEAKKLLVTDMRNQAFLEIIDHAVDQGDMGQAADIVDDLSTPELRDTARARIGTGLARRGNTKAAFAVLDELEIDELSAPIRLEIITALMATKQERKSFVSQ